MRLLVPFLLPALLGIACAKSTLLVECPGTGAGIKRCHRMAEEFCGARAYSLSRDSFKGEEYWGPASDAEQHIRKRANETNWMKITCRP